MLATHDVTGVTATSGERRIQGSALARVRKGTPWNGGC